jgi:hypothetical protein
MAGASVLNSKKNQCKQKVQNGTSIFSHLAHIAGLFCVVGSMAGTVVMPDSACLPR